MRVCFKKNKNNGFTLIELLVVIAIISTLASVVLTSVNSARVNARDAQRISDIRQLRIALELYRNTNGHYPIVPGWVQSNNPNWSLLQADLRPFMSMLPVDPINNDTGGSGPWADYKYNYAYYSTGTALMYDLVAQLENVDSPLRCEVKGWIFYYNAGAAWCPPHNPSSGFSKYTYTGDY